MAVVKKAQAEYSLALPPINIKFITLNILGDTPLVCHKWEEKAKRMILEKQTKKATAGQEKRYPAKEFANSLYWLTEKPDLDNVSDEKAKKILDEIIPQSQFGFPTTAFKASAIDAAYQQGVLAKKTTARGAIHLLGDFVVINGTPVIREDMVKIGMGSADIRFRAEFKSWSTSINIKYNANAISDEQIINLFNIGGFSNGIGEWRPAKDGTFGTYHVESVVLS